MKRFIIALALLGMACLSAVESQTNIQTEQTSLIQEETPLKISLLHEEATIQPGRPFWVLVHVDIKDGWHTYWKNPGDTGMPAQIEWKLPEGFTAGELLWALPHRFSLDDCVGFGYEKEMVLLAEITPPETLSSDTTTIQANVTWLACSSSTCLPGSSQIEATLPVHASAPQIKSEWATRFEKGRANLPQEDLVHTAKENESGHIELNVQLPENQGPFHGALFYPEDKDFIDHKAEVQINRTDAGYAVTLPRLESSQSNSQLRGVLVLDSGAQKVALDIDVPIGDLIAYTPKDEILKTASTNTFEGGLAMALVFAFLGGMILNLMPCVLPVISLKIFSFIKMAGKDRFLTLKHGIAFSAGVIVSFWILAGALLALQAYGESVGWGFQLQEPLFVAILAAIMFILGLSMFGVMELGTSLTALAGHIRHDAEGMTSSFLSGVLATAVATPCTGPFLGSAVGFAVTLPAYLAMLVFTVLGLGMAFPYLLLSAFPSLLRFLPRPGNWMITFKEIMGFFMMATTLWLLWVFVAETSEFSLIILLAAFFFMGIGCWVYGKWGTAIKQKRTRYISYVFTLALFSIALYSLIAATSPALVIAQEQVHDGWEKFSPERVAELQAKGIPVFVDFTAKWCLICQANHAVLSRDQIASKFQKAGVVKMKADWTKNDPVITQALSEFGRNSVPLYVLYGTADKPQVLPQVLTTDVVLDSLKAYD